MKTAIVGAGPAGLLFALLGKLRMGSAWEVSLFDKRETYQRTHRLRVAPEVYRRIQEQLDDPRFDTFVAFLEAHGFSPEVNVLEAELSARLAELGVTKTVREITSLDDLPFDTIVGADSVHSTVRDLVRGDVTPVRSTHERVARLRVEGDALPERLAVLDQFRLSKLLGSLVDYRVNRNGFAEVDLFLTPDEHRIAKSLGATPKAPARITAAATNKLKAPMMRAVIAQLEEGGREVFLQSTFELEHTVMPRVAFETEGGARVFLVGDAAVSLPFFRGMASLAACADALARAHATGALDGYEEEVQEIVRRELAIVRARGQLIRGLRELVRVSSLLPFPIQSWWLSAARDPEPDTLSAGALWNGAVALAAVATAALGLLHPWLALLALPIELAGGVAYRWTMTLEPGPHRYLRRIWEVQIALLAAMGVAAVALGRASVLAAAGWWVLGLAFAIGLYVFERLVARRLDGADVSPP